MSTALNLGFIGLGIMGAPMAGHLLKAGHKLFVNTHGKVPGALVEVGATVCKTNTEVAQQADIVFIMVPDTPDFGAVLFGENGVAAGLSKGKTVVDMSSISPIETRPMRSRSTRSAATTSMRRCRVVKLAPRPRR
jgi:2-hydroxy-3-oxopropionate reductase